jgi:hypothetical protein
MSDLHYHRGHLIVRQAAEIENPDTLEPIPNTKGFYVRGIDPARSIGPFASPQEAKSWIDSQID